MLGNMTAAVTERSVTVTMISAQILNPHDAVKTDVLKIAKS